MRACTKTKLCASNLTMAFRSDIANCRRLRGVRHLCGFIEIARRRTKVCWPNVQTVTVASLSLTIALVRQLERFHLDIPAPKHHTHTHTVQRLCKYMHEAKPSQDSDAVFRIDCATGGNRTATMLQRVSWCEFEVHALRMLVVVDEYVYFFVVDCMRNCPINPHRPHTHTHLFTSTRDWLKRVAATRFGHPNVAWSRSLLHPRSAGQVPVWQVFFAHIQPTHAI